MDSSFLRLCVFFIALVAFTALGSGFGYRNIPLAERWRDWMTNLGLGAVNAAIVRLLAPFLLISMQGLLPAGSWFAGTDTFVRTVLAIVFLDFCIYWQHRLFHQFHWLWVWHRVHHMDTEFDTTLALRFHTMEAVLSLVIRLIVCVLVGIDMVTLALFEFILNTSAMFNHSNFSLPVAIENPLRWLLVTPDMHRVHHSVELTETNSNYGFCLSIWDRLFGSYVAETKQPAQSMLIGLESPALRNQNSFWRLFISPLRFFKLR